MQSVNQFKIVYLIRYNKGLRQYPYNAMATIVPRNANHHCIRHMWPPIMFKLHSLCAFQIQEKLSTVMYTFVETSGEEIRYAIEREIREIIIVRLISLFSTCDWNRYT